jgi:hypothetical protein
MAVCIVMEFGNMNAGQYEAVMEELGLRAEDPSWPSGIISHVAGLPAMACTWWMFGTRGKL